MGKSTKGDAFVRYEAPELRFVRLSHVGTDLVASSTEGYGGDIGAGSWFGGVSGDGTEGYGGVLDGGSWFGGMSGDGTEGYGGVLDGGSWFGGLSGGTEDAGGNAGNERLGVLEEGTW